ncbi:Synembryn-A, partial [Ataeniobius toweri]|nr:Synembryn-A [Ataeniobius toweri]
SRFIKYTGYGNAAGLLAARGLLRGTETLGSTLKIKTPRLKNTERQSPRPI